jgi:hypothetical protein
MPLRAWADDPLAQKDWPRHCRWWCSRKFQLIPYDHLAKPSRVSQQPLGIACIDSEPIDGFFTVLLHASRHASRPRLIGAAVVLMAGSFQGSCAYTDSRYKSSALLVDCYLQANDQIPMHV